MTDTNNDSHEWEDVSYHGVPVYQCAFCHQYESYCREPKDKCPNAQERRREKYEREIKEEFHEYKRLLAERARFDYLHSKYGGGQ